MLEPGEVQVTVIQPYSRGFVCGGSRGEILAFERESPYTMLPDITSVVAEATADLASIRSLVLSPISEDALTVVLDSG
jgi:hypothetical protein